MDSTGYTRMQYGFGTSSDETLKTDIKTIQNGLFQKLLLRGVEYLRFRTKCN